MHKIQIIRMPTIAKSKSNISNEARIAFVAYCIDTLNEITYSYYAVTELESAESYLSLLI
jgi:protoheme ferro-lyase